MAFRTVVISNEAELHVQSGQLIAIQGQISRIPVEDIAVLVIENPRVTISSAALSLLTEQGVAVAVCDRTHMPTGLLLPHCQYCRQLTVTRQQLSQSLPQRKRLWQRLVRVKIDNQAACLEALGLEGAARLRQYSAAVQSGDTTGMEAAAARLYFKRVIPHATRRSPEGPGGALDYGYAIARAAIARALVGHGFYPALGIHHDSQLNAFNLADDVLEPYRPFVDYLTVSGAVDVDTQDGRRTLISVLQAPCSIENKIHSVLSAIETTVASLTRALANKEPSDLVLPRLIAPADIPGALPE